MGIRCDQPQGLPSEAENFLQKNAITEQYDQCPHCGSFTKERMKKKSYSSYAGMFDNNYDLFRYDLTGGGYADEKEQCSIWSAGPVIFLKLVVKSKGKKFEIKWSKKEMEKIVGFRIAE